MEAINISNEIGVKQVKYTSSDDMSFIGTWNLLIKNLDDHAAGVTELMKNSASAMVRARKKENERQCILFLKNSKKKNLIGFLDFVGMERNAFLKLKKLNDPDAALGKNAKEHDVWGGHGNGGKIYAAKMFNKGFWYTLKDKKFNHGGYHTDYVTNVRNIKNKEKFKFKYADEQHVTNGIKKLEALLKPFDVHFKQLPGEIINLIKENQNFTFFIGEDNENIKSKELTKNILEDAEAEEPLFYISLNIYENGKPLKEKKNNSFIFRPENIPPHKEFMVPRKFDIPDKLIDPKTHKEVSFINSKDKYFVIKSCEDDMIQGRFKERFLYRGRLSSGIKKFEGYFKPSELTREYTAFPKHFYGDVFHDELKNYASVTRQNFNDSPFIRALKTWMGGKIDELGREFDKTLKDKIEKTAQEEINKFNKNLEDLFLKNNYVKNLFKGGFKGKSTGEGEGENEKEERKNNTVKQIILKLTYNYSGLGVTFRPNIISYNKTGIENQKSENIVNNPSVNWEISDRNIVDEHERNLNLLYTKKPGKVKIKVIPKDSKLKISSNVVELEVVEFSKISFDELKLELLQGSKKKLGLKLIDNKGNKVNGSYLMCVTNDNNVVSTSSICEIYGLSLGKTKVKCMTNDCESEEAKVEVVENKNKKKKKGGGFPKVLISGIDPCPYPDSSPEPLVLKEKNPPIHQRLRDVEEGVFWINLQSPTASKLHKKGVKKDYKAGEKSKEFKTYLVLKWLEILARVNIINSENQPENIEEFYQYIDNQMVDFHELLKKDLDKILNIDFTKRNEG